MGVGLVFCLRLVWASGACLNCMPDQCPVGSLGCKLTMQKALAQASSPSPYNAGFRVQSLRIGFLFLGFQGSRHRIRAKGCGL